MAEELPYEEKLKIYNRLQEEIEIRRARVAMPPPPPRAIIPDSPPDTPMRSKAPPKKKKDAPRAPRAPRKRKSVAPDRYSDDDFESEDFAVSQDLEDDEVDVFSTKKTVRGKRVHKDAGPDIIEAEFIGPDDILPADEYYSSCDELDKFESKRIRVEHERGSGIDMDNDSEDNKEDDSRRPYESMHSFCYGCEFTNSKNVATVRSSLIDMMEDMFLLEDNENKIARIIHEYYKQEVYYPKLHEGEPVPMWTSKSILKHMHDNLDPRNQLGKLEIKRINKHLKILDSMSYERVKFGNGKSKTRPVDKTLDFVLKFSKQKESIYKHKYELLAFYNKESKINQAAAGSLIKDQHQIKIVRKE